MIRIHVKKLPKAGQGLQVGDQQGYGLQIAGAQDIQTDNSSETSTIRNTLPIVPREDANVEAERGETVVGDFDSDGMNEQSLVGGKPHYAGGTNTQVPAGSFIFSNNRKLRIGGKMLEEFGKKPDGKKKYTPAQLAKQYPLTEHKEKLQDPTSDSFDKQTAALMYDNNQGKLGKLALVQEALKGFPDGIPGIAMPIVGTQETEPVPAKYGGPVKAAYGLENPVDPHKGDRQAPRAYQQKEFKLQKGFNEYSTPWLPNYGYANSSQGFEKALTDAGYMGDKKNNKDIQKFLIAENLRRGNNDLFDNLLGKYGLTNQGIGAGLPESTRSAPDQQTLENIFADSFFGVRSGLMLKELLERDLKPSIVKPVPPFNYDKPNITGLISKISEPSIPPAPVKAITWKKPDKEAMPWWSQDMINLGAAFGNRYNIKKYMPSYVSGPVVTPNPTFYGYRELYANQEQAAQQNMMAAMFAGPQRQRSVASNIQGQSGAIAADTIGKIQNLNVGTANQFEGMKAEILNKKSFMDTAARKQYLDELATVNQQYDNSVREAAESIRSNLIGGMTNAQRTHWLNKFTPQFRIDPTTGRMHFTHGKTLSSKTPGTGEGNYLDAYKNYYDQFLSKMNDPQKAHEFAQKMTFGSRSKFEAASDGDTQMSTTGYGMNPMAMQLLGMYAPQFAGRG